MAELCRVFWGSHGCDLPRGHAGWLVRHQCGLDEDSDGPCSKVERELDEVTGTEVWVQRFADAGGGWGGPFPGWVFGEDLPAGLAPETAEVDALRDAWIAVGKLAHWEDGLGWVKSASGG